ncbi:glycosyltransferase family 4 protein [Salimicrobium flavidum]|uniref:Glycosyltransferase involved in cell wall bisynthesis n=1 Tax=Salimicrobium flavidum TaxID=570947 RepID=A0A1N7KN49_9BACI|nr:glycosyltransferase family 4 protein [Salimicrobium flavidum]SIS62998.1 Glycosyltransferase involved in cell wall bisynthesis [Salimicrobium flavidum]
MNVLLLTDKLAFGGAEIYFCKLENRLSHPDIDFTFAASTGELEKNLIHKDRFVPLQLGKHLQNLNRLKKIIKEKNIQVIHANSLRMALYSIWLKKTGGSPVRIIYTKHNVTALEKRFSKMFTYVLNHHIDKIITVSRFEQDNLTEKGVKKEKVRTIHNGVDLEQFTFVPKQKDDLFKVGILARISPEKNHELFIRIAAELKDLPNARFYIAGDGPDADKIADMIKTRGLSDRVHMLGMVQEPQKFIQSMDVLVLTSEREVFPMVILEAMAVGTPVVSIDRGGIKEAIREGETGFLVPVHSAEKFSDVLLSMYKSDEEVRSEWRKEGRRRAESEFSLKKMVDETVEEYLNYR